MAINPPACNKAKGSGIVNNPNCLFEERIGSDVRFPIVDNTEPVTGVDLIIQDIEQLLLTIPGERVFRPDYGCNLRNQIWENTAQVVDDGPAAIEDALDTFEPRITVTDVTAEANDNTGLVIFNIIFEINNTDTVVNLVFPFRSGTQLSFA